MHYSLLILATITFIFFTAIIYGRTKDLSLVAGFLFLYYFSLFGAWVFVYDQNGGDSGFRYYYLMDKLYNVRLDQSQLFDSYFFSLFYYLVFILIIQLAVFLGTLNREKVKPLAVPQQRFLSVNHPQLIFLSLLFALCSYLLIQDRLKLALIEDISAYVATRGLSDDSVSAFFSLHQLLNRFAILPLMLGFSVMASGADALYIRSKSHTLTFASYALTITLITSYILSLGNKNEILLSYLAGFLFYLINTRKIRKIPLVLFCICAGVILATVDELRVYPTSQIYQALAEDNFLNSALTNLFTSNEAFGSHFSMYAVLSENLELTYGSSLLSLVASIIPRILWSERPDDIYTYYAEGIRATEGQGYSIHHATAWYLNFGFIGIVLGGMVLGLVWTRLIDLKYSTGIKTKTGIIFNSLAAVLFVSYLPSLIRTGPEGYKGLIFDAFLPVLFVFSFACSLIDNDA